MDPGFTQEELAEGRLQSRAQGEVYSSYILLFLLSPPPHPHQNQLLQVHTGNVAMTQVPLILPVDVAVSHFTVIRCLASQSLLTVDPKQQPAV